MGHETLQAAIPVYKISGEQDQPLVFAGSHGVRFRFGQFPLSADRALPSGVLGPVESFLIFHPRQQGEGDNRSLYL